ncbi:MAG: GspH/FimT family pseudopilin [Gemmatimonadota bacterium]
MNASTGTTLAELIAVLTLVGVLTTLAAPRMLGSVDRWVVREAREELVALLYEARMEARLKGEATVRLESGGGAEMESAHGRTGRRWDPSVQGLEIEVAGTRDEAEIRFGPTGLGRFANATILVRRGRVEERLVISSYGRVRR